MARRLLTARGGSIRGSRLEAGRAGEGVQVGRSNPIEDGRRGSVTPGVTPPTKLLGKYAPNLLISLVPAEGLEPPTH